MAKTEKETTDVAVKNTNVAAVADFMDLNDFGQGFEGADADSYALPFLTVLQKMSPQVDPDDPKYIEGAKAGMILNTVTNKVYDGKVGITIVPAAFKRSFIRWGGREAENKGFKGELTVAEVDELKQSGAVKEIDGRLYFPNEDGSVNEKKNDYLADTRQHYVIFVDPESGEFGSALLSLTSSMIKESRKLLTALQQKKVQTPRGLQTPPTFANMVKATTLGQSNDKGSWSTIQFSLESLVTDQNIYLAAKELHSAFTSGTVNVDYSKADNSAESAGGVNDTPEDAEGF